MRPDEIDALFAEAEPIPGTVHLRRPSAHHDLLIAARRLARSGGRTAYPRRESAQDALERDAAAWSIAEQRAPAWCARWALELLRCRHADPEGAFVAARRRTIAELVIWTAATQAGRRTVARRVRARSRRPFLVAFSGLDGSGKSFQASALTEAFIDLGVDTRLVWPPGSNLLFRAGPSVKKALFAVLDRLGKDDGPTARRAEPAGAGDPRPLPSMSEPVVHVLAIIVTLSQVLALRRGASRFRAAGKVIVFDRYVLDSTVYIRGRWGGGRRLHIQTTLLKALVRQPDCAFLLDVPPETAYARKQDFPITILRAQAALYSAERERMGARPLDGERPHEELFSEIAREVWTRLP